MGSKKDREESVPIFRRLFGVDTSDFQSWSALVKMLNRPEDPSSLAVLRILFGVLMMLDIPQERGMSHADVYYPNEDRECQFPLFNFLQPLRAEYMVIVYLVMFLSTFSSPSPSFSPSVCLFRCGWNYAWSVLSSRDGLLHSDLLVRLLPGQDFVEQSFVSLRIDRLSVDLLRCASLLVSNSSSLSLGSIEKIDDYLEEKERTSEFDFFCLFHFCLADRIV